MNNREHEKQVRMSPFTCKDEAMAHHDREFIQCLECGKEFVFLPSHLHKAHGMASQVYRDKWQIRKEIPLAGLAKRKKHSEHIKKKIAKGDVNPKELAGMMQTVNRKQKKKPPFKTQYDRDAARQRLLDKKLWYLSPVVKVVAPEVKSLAVARMRARPQTGERVKTIANEFGVWPNTLYVWEKQFPVQDVDPGN